MSKFISNIFKFVALYLVIGFFIEGVLLINYNKRTYDFEDWHRLDSINAEIVFVGNSRTCWHVDAPRLTKELGLPCYDLGQQGATIKVLTAKLIKYLDKNKPPKLIVLQTDPGFISNKKDLYDKASYLKYIFYDRESINYFLKTLDGFKTYECYLPLVRYIGMGEVFMNHLVGIEHYNKKSGFKAIDTTWLGEKVNSVWNYSLDHIKGITTFKELCNAHGITLIAQFTPAYTDFYKNVKSQTIVNIFLSDHNIPFIDWNKYYNWDDTALFFNPDHLNSTGTQKFNEVIIAHKDLLEQYIK